MTTNVTTSTSTNTGSVTSLGIGSGLDVSSIISSLMSVESQPLTLLQNAAASITTQISAVGNIQSYTSAMGDKASALASTSLWSKTTSTSSDTSVVTSSTASGTATPGSYLVSVQQLAQGQTVTAAAQPLSSSTLSSGTLTIQLGTWTGGNPPTTPATGFTNKDGSSAVSVTIGPGDTSLTSIRDKINAANAGVTASIVTDASGSRLSLRSTDTGLENGFKITATEDADDGNPATGLSALNFDPTSAGSQMSLNQSSMNAKATVNGISVESASNTLDNISDGLSITLQKVSATPVTVGVAIDTASMTSAIQAFVSAYNSLNSEIHTDTKYDSSTPVASGTAKVDGPLQGDPSIIGFQNQLRGIINTTSTTSSMYSRLSDIGISVQSDGSLAIDSTKLNSALANPGEVEKLFTTQGTTDADTGIMVRFANLATNATSTDGSLYTRADGLKSQLMRNGDQQTEMQTHLDATQARLTAQYQALDTTMAQMTALSSYVTQQMAMLAKS